MNLWRLRNHQLRQAQAELVARVLVDSQAVLPAKIAPGSLPGDEQALRGIPAIGRGVTGAIPGTRPGASIR